MPENSSAATSRIERLEQEVAHLLKAGQKHELRAKVAEEDKEAAQKEAYKVRSGAAFQAKKLRRVKQDRAEALKLVKVLQDKLRSTEAQLAEAAQAQQALENLREVLRSLNVNDKLISKIEKNEPPA